MTRSYTRKNKGNVHYTSNSSSGGSSFSSESDIESCSNSDSYDSSDGLELGPSDKSKAQQNFKRLRRIFLNRPAKAKRKGNIQRQRRSSSTGGDKSQVERPPSKTSLKIPQSPHRSSSGSSSLDDRIGDGLLRKPLTSVRPLQAAIDQHAHALLEQMKRHSAQRDSTANQVQNLLEQAVDELQFTKKQEERALESQVRLIRESYALRLEVFQQQYLNTVAEIEDEMYASIQKRQEECDTTILAAAKRLQDQTQQALLKDLALVNNEPKEEQLSSSSSSTVSSSGSQPKLSRHRNARPLRRDLRNSATKIKLASPVSQQRAKLQALEAKLAAFSPESLHRVKKELVAPIRRSKAERTHGKAKRAPVSTSSPLISNNGNPDTPAVREVDEWRALPLSPLREGPSYWKKGISLEARDDEGMFDRLDHSSKRDHMEETSASKPTRRQAPVSLLNRRFLRPEEEEELRHLRTSIGLAKDWMAKNSH